VTSVHQQKLSSDRKKNKTNKKKTYIQEEGLGFGWKRNGKSWQQQRETRQQCSKK
jgi:hypothetical protein